MWLHYIVRAIIDPLFIFWALIAVAIYFHYKRKTAPSKTSIVTALAWLFLVCATPVPGWLTYSLERKYKPLQAEAIDTSLQYDIIILGSGHTLDPMLPPLSQLSEKALTRLAEGIRLYQAIPNARLVLSGYSSTGRSSQAEILALTALSLGVPVSDTLMLIHAENTRQEARDYCGRFSRDQRSLIVVTSAVHMPRAMLYFEGQGLRPISAPGLFLYKKDPYRWRFWFKPSYHNIEMTQSVMHELIGLLAQRLFN